MEERSGENEGGGFLPPEPAGPEPELGGRPAVPPPQPPPPQPPQPQPQPQAPPPTYGYPPPPPGQAYPPPPGAWHPQQPGWGYPQPQVPDNGPAVTGFVLSIVSGGLLVISGGLSSIVSIACAIIGIVYSRKGKRKVDAGETPKHRGLAQAGFIVGWVSLALAVLATLAWIALIVVGISTDGSGGDGFETIRAGARLIGG